MRVSRPLLLFYAAGFLRALGVGFLGVVLGVYLSRVGVSATWIGLVVGAGIAGMSVATATVSWVAPRSNRHRQSGTERAQGPSAIQQGAFAALQVLLACVYLFLPSHMDLLRSESRDGAKPVMSPQSRRVVRNLAALFLIDSFGGGFLTDAVVSYWFFHRFGLTEQWLGVMFFAVHLLNAVSHLGAAWSAQRIGLVNTMVFTHLPSSVFLIAVPLASNPVLAVALFLIRETFVEMDVPTRQSYVAALVQPHERAFASGITNVSRTAGWAAASSLSGAIMQNLSFSAPLVLGGTLKIVYDILLYRSFRHLKPPEELLPPLSPVHEPSSLKSSGDTKQHSNPIHKTR